MPCLPATVLQPVRCRASWTPSCSVTPAPPAGQCCTPTTAGAGPQVWAAGNATCVRAPAARPHVCSSSSDSGSGASGAARKRLPGAPSFQCSCRALNCTPRCAGTPDAEWLKSQFWEAFHALDSAGRASADAAAQQGRPFSINVAGACGHGPAPSLPMPAAPRPAHAGSLITCCRRAQACARFTGPVAMLRLRSVSSAHFARRPPNNLACVAAAALQAATAGA